MVECMEDNYDLVEFGKARSRFRAVFIFAS